MKWNLILQRTSWWHGLFERMFQLVKRCLKKTMGLQDSLTMSWLQHYWFGRMLDFRPLSYVSTKDIEEPLIPSHLLTGYCILSLPDPTICDDLNSSDDKFPCEDITQWMRHLSKTTDASGRDANQSIWWAFWQSLIPLAWDGCCPSNSNRGCHHCTLLRTSQRTVEAR